jgi:DNA-binding response OmpR family regulator
VVGLPAPLVLGSDDPGDSSGRGPTPGGRRLTAVESVTTEGRWEDRIISVVVVEDDPAMRMLVQFNLEAENFHVTLAETGSEGLETVAAEQPDLVLLDVMLPDMGGFDVARRLSGVPIVFMSARASATDFALGRDAGALDYISKPFDPVALPSRLREDLIELDRSGSAAHVWTLRFGHTY